MDALKLTFANGETIQFPFGPDSTLRIETPDGVNGLQHGAWGEITDVAYVKDAGEVVATTVVAGPAETAAPDTTVEPPADLSLLQKVEDKFGFGNSAAGAGVPPHDVAVVAAQTAVDAAASGAPADHVQAALDDVNAALAVYPDSTQLQDAKAQLEQLAAPPAGA